MRQSRETCLEQTMSPSHCGLKHGHVSDLLNETGLTLIFTSLGASFFTSVSSRSPKPKGRKEELKGRCKIKSQICKALQKINKHLLDSHYTARPSSLNNHQPLIRVDPPHNTMVENNVRRRSMSDFWMA